MEDDDHGDAYGCFFVLGILFCSFAIGFIFNAAYGFLFLGITLIVVAVAGASRSK